MANKEPTVIYQTKEVEKECFKYGTLVRKLTPSGDWVDAPIETIKYSDILQGCDNQGQLTTAPIIYVMDHGQGIN